VLNIASKCRHRTQAVALALGLALSPGLRARAATAAPAVPPPDIQSIAELTDLARNAALALLPPMTEGQRLQIGPIAAGLRLAKCDNPQAVRAPGIQLAGRALVELRCAGRASWHLYVPVKIVGTVPVVLSAHALVSGKVLNAKDLSVERRDVTGLPPGYFDDPEAVVGLTAGRALAGGVVLTNQSLVGTQIVQRGQNVTLMADAAGITVRMPGRALTDGMLNQRIRVENLSSGKVVEGIARSAQVVEIVF
jgi:flagella basal body P-ring formation protein FlgA